MKDIIKYSATIFIILLVLYLGINLYNNKANTKVTKLEGYTQNADSKLSVLKEKEEQQEEVKEDKSEEKTEDKEEKTTTENTTPSNNEIPNETDTKTPEITTTEKKEEKQLTANFYIKDKSYASSCTTTTDRCEVEVPEIKVNGYESLGWSEDSNKKEKEISNVRKLTISKNTKLYAIIRKPYTAKFIIQDKNAVETNTNELKCYIYNNEDRCTVKAPTLTEKTNGTAIGWSADDEARTAKIKSGSEITLTRNTVYYSISKLKVVITFDKNTTYNNNTVREGQTGYNYSKSNIAAEKLSFYETSCYSYNGEGCKITKLPVIYSTGNELRGFATAKDKGTTNVYNLNFKDDTTLYARVYNNENRGTFDTYTYDRLGNVAIEMDKNLSQESRRAYLNYLNQLYKDMPELFYMNGKLTLLAKPTYAQSVKGSSNGITGGNVPNILINIPTTTVLDKNREATIVHELGHAFGDNYGRRTGEYPENNKELINLYNKYSNYSTKPLREYSYSHINEFFADIFRFSYEEKFHRGTDIGTATNGYTYKTTEEIKNLFNKYVCIARNDYNTNASCN